MKQYLNNYSLNRPPTPLLKAKLDNLSLVPASMLPLRGQFKALANSYPEGTVVIYHTNQNSKQSKVLDNVSQQLKDKGYKVADVGSEQIL